jgi:hypothetical protein
MFTTMVIGVGIDANSVPGVAMSLLCAVIVYEIVAPA